MTIMAAVAVWLGVGAAFAQSSVSKIEIVEAWARLVEEGAGFTNAYVELINTGDVSDTLLGVTSPWAERSQIVHYVHDGYDMKLTPVTSLKVRAKNRLKLSPSGYFIRLETLTKAMRPGVDIPITLRFEKAGIVEVQAKVGNQKLGNLDP
ncbi:MAG: copper chaperone PCu(A)C [Rhodospirillaceae bacterium]|nr:copper chaperone PCu(A)C [Rhodospirillaceae bacterium]